MTEIHGAINEIRRTFKGENGEEGEVHFGKVYRSGNPNLGRMHQAKVTINKKNYWTRYTNPKAVLLRSYSKKTTQY